MRRYPYAIIAIVLVLAAGAAPAAAKPRHGPAGDAFYTPPSPLPGKRHGDLIWVRKLSGEPALDSARSNRLVLYRSTGSDGRPIAVSGTVSVPKGKAPRKGWPVITFAHGTTGIADQCAPSRDTESSPVHAYNAYVYPLLNRWLKAGFAVVRTDYQGLGTPGVHEYLGGVAEGRSTLDMARAARRLNRHLGRRVIVAGHSQGGHAALWAASLAPKWTRELRVRGTVAFAPASHVSEQVQLASAATTPGGPAPIASIILRGIDAVEPSVGVPSLLSDRAAALYPQTETRCLPQLALPDSFGAIAPSELIRDGADTTALIAALDANDPENLSIPTRVLIEQGEADTTVIPQLTDMLARELREGGVKLGYRTYKDVTHGGIVVAAAKHATRYIRKRLR